MLNKIVLMGRLTRDPELKKTGTGVSVTSFSIACDRDFKNQAGEKECDFINIQAWRQTAEFVCKYFTKGRMAVVEGRLQTRKYQDRDGNNRVATEVVADNVYFGDSKSDGNSQNNNSGFTPAGNGVPVYGGNSTVGSAAGDEEGELPF